MTSRWRCRGCSLDLRRLNGEPMPRPPVPASEPERSRRAGHPQMMSPPTTDDGSSRDAAAASVYRAARGHALVGSTRIRPPTRRSSEDEDGQSEIRLSRQDFGVRRLSAPCAQRPHRRCRGPRRREGVTRRCECADDMPGWWRRVPLGCELHCWWRLLYRHLRSGQRGAGSRWKRVHLC
jgi:hypothetical protein